MVSHIGSSSCLPKFHMKESGEENMKTWKHGRMAYFFGFFLARGVKTCFPKTDGFPNLIFGCHTFPIPCNNQLNQLLAIINDWVNKTRKVVDIFYGFPLWHLDFPHWLQRFEYSPPHLSLGIMPPSHYCCIDIAGCGFLINFIFTWCPKL